ncbi:monoacylglycerol lipase ABHD6-like [Hydractinia symbiolongicarpus]|uniref:monoacylglycerol lipase ABHD6-like n=1 Tax=Hydractinia symbiolongicarpus TaxID=13093 RepID=UPI00254FB7A6|nr:monoacylglycerol lipase ABHD6-like [Hydractinia symbiolongicarpus]
MISVSEIWVPMLWMVGFNTFASIILVSVLMKYPKHAMIGLNRLLCLMLGFSRKTLSLDSSFTFSYIERGAPHPKTPTILFVHGFSSSKECFLQTIKYLPRTYHIIAFDLPGHGETTLKENDDCDVWYFVRYMKKFVDALGISKSKFHIVGTSLGGHFSGVYASQYPEDLISLSFYCPSGVSFEKETQMKDEAERTGSFILLPQNMEEIHQMFDFITYQKVNIPNIYMSGLLQMRLEQNHFLRRLLETMIKPGNFHLLEENLEKIQTPLLLVWGKEDKCLHVECVDTIKKKLPVSPKTVIILDEVGHSIQLERPKKAAEILVKFLDSFY